MKYKYLPVLILLLFATKYCGFCQQPSSAHIKNKVGHLFIIGGGEKTNKLMLELLQVSGLNEEDYVVILPMSSEDPDSSVIYAKDDFAAVGINKVVGFNFTENGPVHQSQIDSIANAKLVFITGGDQTRFMKIVGNGEIYKAIHRAYTNGSTIAGTSAGAAVMSAKMITGNALKYPEYTGKYPTIEPGNIEITKGLGLIPEIIVDQHFIKRQRFNRLLAVVIENPNETCVGIDESTAVVVTGNSFTVAGENQVIVLQNPKKNKKIQGNLLGGRGLTIEVLLPGETWKIK